MINDTEAKDVETPDDEQTRRSSHCSTVTGGGEDCFDSVPPRLRSSGLAIAADLVRQVDCQHRPIACEAAKKIIELTKALDESVKLQSHYAELLNMHDGGERIGFETASAWVARLYEVGAIRP